MNIAEKYMQRAIQLAKNGRGSTYPNPLVGSVIVHEDKIIGEGWHYKAGQPHAEVNAIESVTDKTLLKKSTLYVTLEPCSHVGKTPPCADRILTEGIPKVVIGCTDPNPKVAGNGIKKLKSAGCEVITKILEGECTQLNKRFFTFQTKKRPYIFLKWAMTPNGYIAPISKDKQAPVWITNTFARQLAHKMRAREQAILVGTNTVRDDNPSLTSRDWAGPSPLRIAIDKKGTLPQDLQLFNGKAKTLIFTEVETKDTKTTAYECINFDANVPQQLCAALYTRNIQSLIIEGGAQTLQYFIDVDLWDEAVVFTGETIFSEGVKAPVLKGKLISETRLTTDQLTIYTND